MITAATTAARSSWRTWNQVRSERIALDAADDLADEAGAKVEDLVAEVGAVQDVEGVGLLDPAFDADLFELDHAGGARGAAGAGLGRRCRRHDQRAEEHHDAEELVHQKASPPTLRTTSWTKLVRCSTS